MYSFLPRHLPPLLQGYTAELGVVIADLRINGKVSELELPITFTF